MKKVILASQSPLGQQHFRQHIRKELLLLLSIDGLFTAGVSNKRAAPIWRQMVMLLESEGV